MVFDKFLNVLALHQIAFLHPFYSLSQLKFQKWSFTPLFDPPARQPRPLLLAAAAYAPLSIIIPTCPPEIYTVLLPSSAVPLSTELYYLYTIFCSYSAKSFNDLELKTRTISLISLSLTSPLFLTASSNFAQGPYSEIPVL